ncbi:MULTISPECIES: hypothetical protein [unclassified Streptomyces]|uniref:hypothetical protein n=1 Tax=unclassified Streptomyces TaxID=2593676 RepID=UPI0035E06C92
MNLHSGDSGEEREPVMMLWRHILAALHGPDTAHREQLLAVGAAALAHAHRLDGHPADAEAVCRIALEEFGVLLDPAAAAAALANCRHPSGGPHEVPVPETPGLPAMRSAGEATASRRCEPDIRAGELPTRELHQSDVG